MGLLRNIVYIVEVGLGIDILVVSMCMGVITRGWCYQACGF